MNSSLFERLLYEEESTALDFKKEQYRFSKASEDEKSELLKDILGFANAWRRSEAYILIGVRDLKGTRKNVVGIAANDHLDDHALQQFVNNLTNQPVRFHYQAFEFEGKQVGILSVDEQIRPIYLKRDYGKLKKEQVYVRRGSSTDPTKPASLEEIAQMRVGSSHAAEAEVIVEFAAIGRDDSLGTTISWEAEFCEMPPMETIPDLAPLGPRYPFGIELADPFNRPNENFFRELANFEFARRLFRPVRLVVRNVGHIAANNARVELTVPADIGVAVLDELPKRPKEQADFLPTAAMKAMRSYRSDPGDVSMDKNDERVRIDIDCGHLQPGRRVWSEVFYIGKADTGSFSLDGLIFGDRLPRPKEFALNVSATATQTKMTLNELRSLPE